MLLNKINFFIEQYTWQKHPIINMKVKLTIRILFITAISLLTLTLACRQQDESKLEMGDQSPTPAAEEAVADDIALEGSGDFYAGESVGREKTVTRKKGKTREKKKIDIVLLKPFEKAGDRLLEYNIQLTYRTTEFLVSRKKLLEITAKYGFIKSNNTSTWHTQSSLNSELHIRTNDLYNALLDLDSLGDLVSENISVSDHTPAMTRKQIQIKRENLRIARRNRASGKIGAAAKNWSQIEESLAESEDSLDEATYERWELNDRVAWAKFKITVLGPEYPKEVDVPVYRNAFVTLLNGLLELLYLLILLSPFLIIGGILVWKWSSIKALLKKNK